MEKTMKKVLVVDGLKVDGSVNLTGYIAEYNPTAEAWEITTDNGAVLEIQFSEVYGAYVCKPHKARPNRNRSVIRVFVGYNATDSEDGTVPCRAIYDATTGRYEAFLEGKWYRVKYSDHWQAFEVESVQVPYMQSNGLVGYVTRWLEA